jgi:hypothetical protein
VSTSTVEIVGIILSRMVCVARDLLCHIIWAVLRSDSVTWEIRTLQQQDRRILGLALETLYGERQRVNVEISAIERRLGLGTQAKGQTRPMRASKTRLSAAGRKAISEAMKRRWARERAVRAKTSRR